MPQKKAHTAPMTMAERILARASGRERVKPNEYITAGIDKMIAHEAFAAVFLNLAQAGIESLLDPDRIVVALDHYVPAPTERAASIHQLVRQAVDQYGIKNYYGENNGVAHQVVMENGHALPGELILGTDSHTCTYGALGAASCGIGFSEMAYAMAKGELWFRVPETVRFVLEGRPSFPAASKDVILKIAGEFSSEAAQYKSVEFTGPGATAMSISERMTVSNMAVEIGAKFGLFAPDEKTAEYLGLPLDSLDFPANEEAGAAVEHHLDLNNLKSMTALPHAVDNVKPVSEAGDVEIHQAVLGSCTNGRMEDLRQAALLLKGRRIHPRTRLLVVPASREIYKQAMKDGTLEILIDAGGVILNPGCGPCFGAHHGILAPGENCVSSTNRNFKGRMGSDQANIYLASPATVAASAVAGRLTDPAEL